MLLCEDWQWFPVIFFAINVVVFLVAEVHLPFYLPSFTLARSTLEGWKVRAFSHLLCSPVFHI